MTEHEPASTSDLAGAGRTPTEPAVSETFRAALQRYRSFFERLLAA